MASLPKPYYEPAEYLTLERAAAYKSEYLAGEIFAMAGASEEHNTITLNIASELRIQLRGSPCRAYANDMRVKVQASGLYTYPDVVAVCGERRFEDGHRDTLLNPTVIFEVLSPSTEGYDRGKKFALYRGLESLQEYLLVAQDEARVEHYIRHDHDWVLRDVADTIQFAAIAAVLPLAAVYENVALPPSAADAAPA
ncbi:MAG: Uma2 family endonuclease [Chloroflexota bacterium]|nr:Uma2 family endonuclease [Chloroflexota bacterium]